MSAIVLGGQSFAVTAAPITFTQGDDDARAVSGAMRRTRLYGRRREWRLVTSFLTQAEVAALETALDTAAPLTLDLTSWGAGTATVLVSLESKVPTPSGAGILWTLTLRAAEA